VEIGSLAVYTQVPSPNHAHLPVRTDSRLRKESPSAIFVMHDTTPQAHRGGGMRVKTGGGMILQNDTRLPVRQGTWYLPRANLLEFHESDLNS